MMFNDLIKKEMRISKIIRKMTGNKTKNTTLKNLRVEKINLNKMINRMIGRMGV